MLLCLAAVACAPDPDALLLTVEAPRSIEAFDLRVRDLERLEVVLERVGEPVARDITAEPLRLVIEFARPGRYRLHMLGHTGAGVEPLFALRDFTISGLQQGRLALLPLKDKDGDGLPGCEQAGVLDCTEVVCEALDCNDNDRNVNPFSFETCGNGKDDDCSAGCAGGGGAEGDEVCEDKDGDGVGGPADCDDEDPCRSPKLKEAESLCDGQGEGLPALPKACLDHLAAQGTAPPVAPFCGDGIDQDCNGQDATCRVDADCDGISPPADCDDTDPAVSPKASEACDGVDNNCNDVVDEGCVPCDVDGDGHAAPGTTVPDCVDDGGKPLPTDDPDDFDSGIFPGATASSAGAEGGTVEMALRGYCGAAPTKDGRPAREVDHDGDGKPAADDGCPTVACDADGDGFAGAACNPPASLTDCDDTDPETFPGAPDRCGDGKAQNCVADAACAGGDGDGDGYASEHDCDDGDADRHPWALERCDGLDNDCDGLVDEGNPDPDGKPMPTGPQGRSCNDSDEGQCGGGEPATTAVCDPLTDVNCSAAGRELSGTCACSRATPTGSRGTSRVACPGEDLGAKASPRCFGAKQPQIERCDAADWDCDGRQDDPEGSRPLVDAGKSCSTGVGSCVPGQVTGCDLGQSLPEAALAASVLGAAGIEFNPHWVCDGALLPTAEVCNGKDDDCDGALPAGEADGDGDGHLACGGCTSGGERLSLAAHLAGCDDCDDQAISVHPGALEVCNGIDDNCESGLTDDGAADCGAGESCCAGLGTCYDLDTNTYHCGACGNRCDVDAGEKCSAGQCVCGDTGGACAPGQDCVDGSCRCVFGGSCAGCCDGNTCRPSTIDHCGESGAGCDACAQPSGECEAALCQSGSCSLEQAGDGSACSGGDGQCWDGVCCSGDKCWDGGKCVPGKSDENHCGVDGVRCAECSSDENCEWGDCWAKN